MGLDIYVGSLTRYYCHDWETIVQKYAREEGINFQTVRPDDKMQEKAITDPEKVRPIILKWQESLSKGIEHALGEALRWDETPSAPYFTDKPAWDSYASLILWAAYSEQQDLARPLKCIEEWHKDQAYIKSTEQNFNTAYPTLLREVEFWLPQNFQFIFNYPLPNGKEVVMGSAYQLFEELTELNSKTWQATKKDFEKWQNDGAEYLSPMETGAKFAFSILYNLSKKAIDHNLVMMLDY